jgi:hypothetical protein
LRLPIDVSFHEVSEVLAKTTPTVEELMAEILRGSKDE